MALHQRVHGASAGSRTTPGESRTMGTGHPRVLLVILALFTLAGAVPPVAPRAPSSDVAVGVGGAGGAELAELAEREVAANGTNSALSANEGGDRHTTGTIREALGGGVVEVDMGSGHAGPTGPPERLRTGGSRCSKPQECIRVDQCPPRDSGVLFECAAGRVCCVPATSHGPPPVSSPASNGAPHLVEVPQQQQPQQQPPRNPAQHPATQQPAQHPAPHPAQHPAPQPTRQPAPHPAQHPAPQSAQHPAPQPAQHLAPHPTPQPAYQSTQQPRPQPSYQESPKPRPGIQVTPQQTSTSPQQPQRPQVTPQQPVDPQPPHTYHQPPNVTTHQSEHQQEAPRPQPPKFTIHLEPQTQRVPSKTSPAPPTPASALPDAPHSPAEGAKTPDPAPSDLLPGTNTCGKVGTENRIINGKIASIGQFPWMALLGYRSSANVTFLCGGTLINDRYVLTAAHCIRSQNRPVVVRLGEFNLTEPVDCDHNKVCAPPPLDIAVEGIVSHAEFNIRNIKHDIALVRLSRSVIEYTDFVRPICLPVGLNVTDDKKFKIAGWGKTDFRDAGGSPVLQFTDVNGVGHEECNELQPPELQPLDPGQLCAGGDKGKDACKGDSGGPLMVTLVNEDLGGSTVTYQIGVVSYGPDSPCGTAPLPSIYTRVSAYVPWILDTIRP